MITSKQRSYLRSIANNLDVIFQIGKNGIGDNLIYQLNDALKAREIVKIKVLENCDLDIHQAANIICNRTNSEIVQIIGSKITIYRKSDKNIYNL